MVRDCVCVRGCECPLGVQGQLRAAEPWLSRDCCVLQCTQHKCVVVSVH